MANPTVFRDSGVTIPTDRTDLLPILRKHLEGKYQNVPLCLPAGNYQGGVFIENAPNLIIQADSGATVFGFPGADVNSKAVAFGLRFQYCDNLYLASLTCLQATLVGIWVQDSTGLCITSCASKFNGRHGILTSNVSQVHISTSTCSYNGYASETDTTGNALGQHGIYLSESGDDLNIIGCYCDFNKFSGIQINAQDDNEDRSIPSHDSKSIGTVISGCYCRGNQRGGGAAGIQLAGVHSFLVDGNHITNHKGKVCLALYASQPGDKPKYYGCTEITVTSNEFSFDNTIQGFKKGSPKANVQIRNSSMNKVAIAPSPKANGFDTSPQPPHNRPAVTIDAKGKKAYKPITT